MTKYIFKIKDFFLRIEVRDNAVHAVDFTDSDMFFSQKITITKSADYTLAFQVAGQLKEYFEGKRKIFNLNYSFSGTEFEKQVWKEISKVKFGDTISYSELALRIGNPKSTRAVANALSHNKLAILIPCHRIIAKNGNIGGYKWGVNTKLKLLNIENNHANLFS